MVGRLDQKQTIPSAVSSNLTHQVEPVEVGDCLGLRQHTLRESLKSASPIGSSIRYANNTLGTRLSKLRLERKPYKSVGAPPQAKPPLISAGSWAAKFRRALTQRRVDSRLAIGVSGRSAKRLQRYLLNQTQRQPQTRRPRFHQQRWTRRRGRRRGTGRTTTAWALIIQSSRAPGARSSSGIACTVSEHTARPAAATAVPNRNPRAKLRRSINSIDGPSLDRLRAV